MKNSFKTELWKALHNPMFYVALAIGCLIVMINVVENIPVVEEISANILEEDHVGSRSPWGFSLFFLWMPVNGMSYGKTLFFLA